MAPKIHIPDTLRDVLTDYDDHYKRTSLVITSGLPGLGKSTFASTLAKLSERIHHLKGDDIWSLVCPQKFQGNLVPLGYELMEVLVKGWFIKARHVIVDTTAITREHRARFLKLHREDYPKFCVMFKPDLELSIKRRVPHVMSKSNIRGMYDRWEEPSLNEGFDGIFRLESK